MHPALTMRSRNSFYVISSAWMPRNCGLDSCRGQILCRDRIVGATSGYPFGSQQARCEQEVGVIALDARLHQLCRDLRESDATTP